MELSTSKRNRSLVNGIILFTSKQVVYTEKDLELKSVSIQNDVYSVYVADFLMMVPLGVEGIEMAAVRALS